MHPHQEQPNENSAYVRFQNDNAPGERCHDFYFKNNGITWHRSFQTKQIFSVRQEGLIMAKNKLIMHKCVHFKENYPEKARVEEAL